MQSDCKTILQTQKADSNIFNVLIDLIDRIFAQMMLKLKQKAAATDRTEIIEYAVKTVVKLHRNKTESE